MDEPRAESTGTAWQTARGSSELHALSLDREPRVAVNIEAVPLGARVPTKNPNRSDYDFRFGEVVQAEWSRLVIAVQRNDGAQITLELLRPNWSVRDENIPVGSQFHLSVAELDVEGTGTLLECGPCPAIAEGEGAVVTGRFITREVLEIVHLTMQDGIELSGTPVHPIWSVDRTGWVRLDALQSGEHLQTDFDPMPIANTQRIIAPQSVYNLEIEGEHVYEVTDLGILVHNANPLCEELKKLLAQQDKSPADLDRIDELRKLINDQPAILPGSRRYNEPPIPGYDKHHLDPDYDRNDPAYPTGPTVDIRNDDAGGRLPDQAGRNYHTRRGRFQHSLRQHITDDLAYTMDQWKKLPDEIRRMHLKRYYASLFGDVPEGL